MGYTSRSAIVSLLAVLTISQLACANNSTPTEPSVASSTMVLTSKTLSLDVGDSTQVRVVAVAADNTQRVVTTSGTWTSANDAVATVTAGGVVTGHAPGTADITVTVSEGTATVAVTVSNEAQSQTFVGAAAGASGQTGTLKFFVSSPPRLSGTLYVGSGVFSLIGRVDDETHVVDLSGGSYRFLGVISGNVVTGAYVDTLGLTGGFSAIDATHTAATVFCGSYTSDGHTALANADSGAIVLVVSADGTVAASALAADASLSPQTFAGRIEAGALSLVSRSGGTMQGQLQGEGMTGTFMTTDGSPATFRIASSICH